MSSGPGGDTPESQLVVDTLAIRRHPGAQHDFSATAMMDELVVGEFAVVDGRISIELVIEAVAEGVVAKGTVVGRWSGPCRRCLEAIEKPFAAEMREVFERNPTEGETWPIEEERIDLVPVLRETALLALPLAPLCRDECAGPAPERFPATVEADVDLTASAPVPDPRWAALDDLRFDE